MTMVNSWLTKFLKISQGDLAGQNEPLWTQHATDLALHHCVTHIPCFLRVGKTDPIPIPIPIPISKERALVGPDWVGPCPRYNHTEQACDWGWSRREPVPSFQKSCTVSLGVGGRPERHPWQCCRRRPLPLLQFMEAPCGLSFWLTQSFFSQRDFKIIYSSSVASGSTAASSLGILIKKQILGPPRPSSWVRQILWGQAQQSGLQKVLLVILKIEATVLDYIVFFKRKRKQTNKKNKLHSIR